MTNDGCEAHLATMLAAIGQTQDVLQCLHSKAAGLLLGNLEVAHGEHARAVRGVEPQLDLRLDLALVRQHGVVNERAAARVGRLLARRRVFQALYDSLTGANECLRTIVATCARRTVLPEPLWPTMTVTGEKNSMTAICLSSNERIPRIASLFSDAIDASVTRYCNPSRRTLSMICAVGRE